MEDFKVKIKLNKKQTKSLFKQLKTENHYGDCVKIGVVTFMLDKVDSDYNKITCNVL